MDRDIIAVCLALLDACDHEPRSCTTTTGDRTYAHCPECRDLVYRFCVQAGIDPPENAIRLAPQPLVKTGQGDYRREWPGS